MSRYPGSFFLFGKDAGMPEHPGSESREFFAQLKEWKIYHSVSEEHVASFESGRILLSSSQKIRNDDPKNPEGVGAWGMIAKDPESVRLLGNKKPYGKMKDDFFFFCMSRSKNIGDVLGGRRAFYEVQLSELISVIGNRWEDANFWEHTKRGELEVFAVWAQPVSYTDFYPVPLFGLCSPPMSDKPKHFQKEKEIRLSFRLRERNSRSGIAGRIQVGEIFIVLSPDEWRRSFCRIG